MVVAKGMASCSSPIRFPSSSNVKMLTPVRLPPGRLRLSTSPIVAGSPPTENTMGTVAVAAFAAKAEGSPPVAISTSIPRLNRSLASSGKRSKRPSAQRYSIATFVPST